jgi:5-methylcytosine-specific restriction endonuclease McrA
VLEIYRKKFKRRTPPILYPEGPGRREVCSKTPLGQREYRSRTETMEIRQNFKCAICVRVFLIMTFDHQGGRGHNGSIRDDRILDEKGNWKNAALCIDCNKFKASKRYRWIGGEYLPIAV